MISRADHKLSQRCTCGHMNRSAVALMTLTRSENYGTVLQAYAAKKLLESRTDVINFHLIRTDVRAVRRRRMISFLNFLNPSFGFTRIANFASMRLFLMPHTCHDIRTVDLSNRGRASRKLTRNFELFVTGSDEIWNLAFLGPDSLYYLPPSLGRLRVSMATSANRIDRGSLSGASIATLRSSLEGYSVVTVRDWGTQDLVREITNGRVVPTLMIDPTLLYSFPEVSSVPPCTARRSRTALLMMKDRALADIVIRQLAARGLDVKSVFIKYPRTEFLRLSPLEFVKEFSNHYIVITDFFHGTCMSIRSRANFISIDRELRYEGVTTKIGCILRMIHADSRYLNLVGAELDDCAARIETLMDRLLDKPELDLDAIQSSLLELRISGLAEVDRIVKALVEAVDEI